MKIKFNHRALLIYLFLITRWMLTNEPNLLIRTSSWSELKMEIQFDHLLKTSIKDRFQEFLHNTNGRNKPSIEYTIRAGTWLLLLLKASWKPLALKVHHWIISKLSTSQMITRETVAPSKLLSTLSQRWTSRKKIIMPRRLHQCWTRTLSHSSPMPLQSLHHKERRLTLKMQWRKLQNRDISEDIRSKIEINLLSEEVVAKFDGK